MTLVQQTIERLHLPPTNIYPVTEKSHAELLRQQTADIPKENVVVEPDRKGTAGAIALGLAAMQGNASDQDIVVALPADHLIRDKAEFRTTFRAWTLAAQKHQKIVTLGIPVTYPSTGFGYIHRGQGLGSADGYEIFEINQFVEKPSEETAKKYLNSGDYFWNAGMFAAPLAVFRKEYAAHLPKHAFFIEAGESSGPAARKGYLALQAETIDYGLLEKSKNLAVIPASFDWADVGSWADLHDVLEHDADDNVFEGEYVDIDTKSCFVYSPDQLVATIGLENLVIINTKDAVLICPKDRAQDVKKVVEKLKQSGRGSLT